MLNPEQEAAVAAMTLHCTTVGDSNFFIIEGAAGTGKTFCMSALVQRMRRRIVFTAPTNKAVKVLRETLRTEEYRPECKTIYSLLGLTMSANGEIKELAAPEEDVDLGVYAVVVIDEASMLNKAILGYIYRAAKAYPNIRWIFMGDRWQLPPVGENMSEVWELCLPEKRALLTQIMRQDNQILRLSARVREQIENPFRAISFGSDNDDVEGVWSLGALGFETAIRNDAEAFRDGKTKAISWRNATVDRLNSLIRQELFADSQKYFWQPDDRITMLEPGKDLEGKPMITTDEEGTVERVDISPHPEDPEFICWRILVRTDFNQSVPLWVLHPNCQNLYMRKVARLSAEAKVERRRWKEFWAFKEQFHSARHAYATTAHRAQGSTYTKAYVNWRDILVNQTRTEAYRCLYVGVTRPKKELYLG